jgi:hypothetical protein
LNGWNGAIFSLSPTKLGDRYRLDELTFANSAATGGNAPIGSSRYIIER